VSLWSGVVVTLLKGNIFCFYRLPLGSFFLNLGTPGNPWSPFTRGVWGTGWSPIILYFSRFYLGLHIIFCSTSSVFSWFFSSHSFVSMPSFFRTLSRSWFVSGMALARCMECLSVLSGKCDIRNPHNRLFLPLFVVCLWVLCIAGKLPGARSRCL